MILPPKGQRLFAERDVGEGMEMNAEWAAGFIVGILIVAVVCGIALRKAFKNGMGRGKYDERQQGVRGRAFTWAYFTLLFYLAGWIVLRSLEIPFFTESLSIAIGALLSIGVFAAYSIFHDAYFKASERPRAWILLIASIGLLNLGLGIGRLVRQASLRERLYDNYNLFMGLLMIAVLVCLVVKRAMDRRGEED